MTAWVTMVAWFALGGCSWLSDVPENRVVERVATEAPRVREVPAEDTDEEVDAWNPVSRPIVPDNPTPVKFQSAAGEPITGRVHHKDYEAPQPASLGGEHSEPDFAGK